MTRYSACVSGSDNQLLVFARHLQLEIDVTAYFETPKRANLGSNSRHMWKPGIRVMQVADGILFRPYFRTIVKMYVYVNATIIAVSLVYTVKDVRT